MVEKTIRIPEIHLIFGQLDGNNVELHDKNIVYFMRSVEDAVPAFDTLTECMAEMPDYMIIGSMNGRYLASLEKLLVYVSRKILLLLNMSSLFFLF